MMNSPCGKYIGVLPAQHPPDCTNITAPPRLRRRSIAASAAGVAVIRAGWVIAVSEQAERFAAVADQQVLRLAVVVEHHPVVLPANAGDLVTAERRTRGVLVVAVRPDPAGFDTAAHLVGADALEIANASASSVKVVTARTGPKISSWNTRILLSPLSTVGWQSRRQYGSRQHTLHETIKKTGRYRARLQSQGQMRSWTSFGDSRN